MAADMSKLQLLPCPFCGETPMMTDEQRQIGDNPESVQHKYYVRCLECGCTGPQRNWDITSEWWKAARAWNIRFHIANTDQTSKMLALEMGISVRARRILKHAIIDHKLASSPESATLADIAKLSESELMSVRTCGNTTFREIVTELSRHGLSLRKD